MLLTIAYILRLPICLHNLKENYFIVRPLKAISNISKITIHTASDSFFYILVKI